MIDIQGEVEQLEIYILARCPVYEQQILYSEMRTEDILGLSKSLSTSCGATIEDKLRIFKGKHNFQKPGRLCCTLAFNYG